MNKGYKWNDQQESFDVSFCPGTPTGAHRSPGSQFAKKDQSGSITETTNPFNTVTKIATGKVGNISTSDHRSDKALENTQARKNYEKSIGSNDSKLDSPSPFHKVRQQSIDMVTQKTP
jgi:hypothetical protein